MDGQEERVVVPAEVSPAGELVFDAAELEAVLGRPLPPELGGSDTSVEQERATEDDRPVIAEPIRPNNPLNGVFVPDEIRDQVYDFIARNQGATSLDVQNFINGLNGSRIVFEPLGASPSSNLDVDDGSSTQVALTGPTRETVREALDDLPDGQGENFTVVQRADGSFVARRMDIEATGPLRVTLEGDLFSPVRLRTGIGGTAQENREIGLAVEQEIAERNPGSDTQASFQTSDGFRFIDVLTIDEIAIESKVGKTSLTNEIRRQVLKDAELIANVDIRGATFEFTRSPITGEIGPTQALRDFLEENGIDIVIND